MAGNAPHDDDKITTQMVDVPISGEESDLKEVNVLSVELTDAVAKDKPNYRSRSQIALFSFMLFATLSRCNLFLPFTKPS